MTNLYRSWNDKNGNPNKTSDGREYERVAFKCKEYGDKYVSGFGNRTNKDWKVGMEVEVEIEEKGQYINFKMPDKLVELEKRIEALENKGE